MNSASWFYTRRIELKTAQPIITQFSSCDIPRSWFLRTNCATGGIAPNNHPKQEWGRFLGRLHAPGGYISERWQVTETSSQTQATVGAHSNGILFDPLNWGTRMITEASQQKTNRLLKRLQYSLYLSKIFEFSGINLRILEKKFFTPRKNSMLSRVQRG